MTGGRSTGQHHVVLTRTVDLEQAQLGARPRPAVFRERDTRHLAVGVVASGLRKAPVVEEEAVTVVQDGRVTGEAALPWAVEEEDGPLVPQPPELEAHAVRGRDQMIVEEELASASEFERLLGQPRSAECEGSERAGRETNRHGSWCIEPEERADEPKAVVRPQPRGVAVLRRRSGSSAASTMP